MFIATSGPAIDWLAPHRAELEPIAGERERARAIAIARVLRQRRQHVDADGQPCPLSDELRAALLDLLEDVVELVAQEDRNNRGRCLVGARRWSLPAVATTARSSPDTCTRHGPLPRRTPETARCRAACRRVEQLPCDALPSDQFTCLPEPLTPANGFSCVRHAMPYFSATRLSVIITSC